MAFCQWLQCCFVLLLILHCSDLFTTVRAAYKESSTGVVHPRLSVHRSFTRLNEVGNSFLEAAESFSSSEDISNISVHDYNKEFVEAFDAQSEHDDHIDDAKLKKAQLFIGLYIGLTVLLSWVVRRIVHGVRHLKGWHPRPQHFSRHSKELLDKKKIHWGKGSVFKDFWYYHCNNHVILSMALTDKDHPVGPWKRRFIFYFTETITIAFVYVARSIWDVKVYYNRLIFLILILGPINGITNFILHLMYACPCLHQKLSEYDSQVKCLMLRKTVDVLGVLISLPFIVGCFFINYVTARSMADDEEGVPIDIRNMIQVYILSHALRWFGLPLLDWITRFNTKKRYTARLFDKFNVYEIGIYQDFNEKPLSKKEKCIMLCLRIGKLKLFEIIGYKNFDVEDGKDVDEEKENTLSQIAPSSIMELGETSETKVDSETQ
mmetsp:Transcript_18480/g.23908  ORF Transcript_18480/g.23908 Transcript_18480/m.23908 type:complete len:434 (-) Transcript_18480:145-1446(-)